VRDYKIPKNNLGTDRLSVLSIYPKGQWCQMWIDILSTIVFDYKLEKYFTVEITSEKIRIYKNGTIFKEMNINLE